MDMKVVFYLAIFFATFTIFEAEAEKPKNKLARKAFRVCRKLADKVAELNPADIDLTRRLEINNFCLSQVQKNGTV